MPEAAERYTAFYAAAHRLADRPEIQALARAIASGDRAAIEHQINVRRIIDQGAVA